MRLFPQSEAVHTIYSSGVAHVFLQRGDVGNELDAATVAMLLRHLHVALEQDGVRALVLRQKGRNFCTGLQLAEAVDHTETATQFTDILSLLHNAPLLTVAFVEGAAHGAGVGLAAACDVVIAAPNAQFALPETSRGHVPTLIMPTLIRRLPIAKAKTMALSQRTFGALDAHTMGLVDDVGHEEKLYAQLQALMRAHPEAITSVKSHINDLIECPPDVHGELAVQAYTRSLSPKLKPRTMA